MRYTTIRCVTFAYSLALLLPIWLIHVLVMDLTPKNLITVDSVRALMLSKALYLLPQSERQNEFKVVLATLQSLETSQRKNVFQGKDMELWFYRLKYAERVQLMQAVIPQLLDRKLQSFVHLSKKEKLEKSLKIFEEYQNEDELAEVLDQFLSHDENKDIRSQISEVAESFAKENPEILHGILMTHIFDIINIDEKNASDIQKIRLLFSRCLLTMLAKAF